MDKLRVAIVGAAGGRGRWFVEQVLASPRFELVSIVDHLVDAVKLVRDHLGVPDVNVYRDTAQALDESPCDAIIVATTDAAHIGPTLEALSRGLHVYVEKPLATTVADCLSIVEADERAGGKIMVGFNLRFAPFYRKMKELVTQGTIGKTLTIQADEFYHKGRTYFRRWNRLRESGGGLWITKASHDFDLLYWMAGRLPKSVEASANLSHFVRRPEGGMRCSECDIESTCIDSSLGSDILNPPLWHEIAEVREKNGWPPRDLCLYNSDKDTFDHGIVTVRFSDDLFSVYTVNVVAPITDRRMRISGTNGMIEGAVSVPEVTFYKRDREHLPAECIPAVYEDTDSGASHGGGDSKLLDEFALFVRGEIPAPVAPATASVAVALGVAATKSGDSKSPVNMSSLEGWKPIAERL